MGDSRRFWQRTIGMAMAAFGLFFAAMFFLNASSESGAADIEQTYCAETPHTSGTACEMDSTERKSDYQVAGVVALVVAAAGGVVVYRTPKGSPTRF